MPELDFTAAQPKITIVPPHDAQTAEWLRGQHCTATFYLIEGNYTYLVEKNGTQSQKYSLSVAPPARRSCASTPRCRSR
jgi:hypothetical protein